MNAIMADTTEHTFSDYLAWNVHRMEPESKLGALTSESNNNYAEESKSLGNLRQNGKAHH